MQKTVLTPFFETSEKSIARILKQRAKVLYEQFYKKMDITLQKIGANAYTRTVRRLIESDKVFLGYSASATGSEVPVFSVYISTQHLLAGIVADIVRCSPDSAHEVIEIIKKLEKIYSEIASLQKRIDDAAIEKVAQLKDEGNKLQEDLSNLIDYPRVAEAIYFSFIRYIVAEIDQGSSVALFDLSAELFKKILQISIGDLMNIENKTIYNAAIDYIFTVSFTNLTPREVLHNIARRYGADIAEMLRKINIVSIKSMDKLPALLGAIKVINITPIALNNAIAKRFGTNVLSMIYGTYDYFVAWAVVSAHHSILFNMGPVDKEIQLEMEKIILNYKSKVRF